MNRLIPFVLILFIASCGPSKNESENPPSPFLDQDIQTIYQLGNERNTLDLLPFAESKTPSHRMAFAKVMGSIQDAIAFESLSNLVRDPIPYVRLYAIYALGQYRDTIALSPLEKAVKKATIPEIKAEVLEAIGKCSNERAMDYLLFHEPSTEIEETGKMRGIYQGMLRGYLDEADLRIVVAHLKSGNKDTRLAAAHVLERQRDYSLGPFANEIKNALEEENSGEVRAVLLKSTRGMEGFNELFSQLARQDSDPRVRATALALLGGVADQSLILNGLEDGSVWVAMIASTLLSDLDYETHSETLKSIARTSPIPEVRGAILNLVLANEKNATGFWKEIEGLSKNDVEAAALISTLGNYSKGLDTLLKHLPMDNAKGSAAAQALIEGARNFPEWEGALAEAAKISFNRGLPGQAFHFSYAFAEGEFETAGRSCIDAMQEGIPLMKGATAIETRNEMRRAISRLTAEEYTPEKPSEIMDIDFELISNLPEKASASIYTEVGTFQLALLNNDAPSTVSNFVKLAREGFYDGTHFHRIVPVFVSQGGGNRGDGFGGPDYSIRSEFSPLQYGEGILGMASAGKDTEGSQFFITHISTPHLDGRYTIFAALTEGFDLLDDVRTGMRIDSVQIAE